jgi:hypothetical protein
MFLFTYQVAKFVQGSLFSLVYIADDWVFHSLQLILHGLYTGLLKQQNCPKWIIGGHLLSSLLYVSALATYLNLDACPDSLFTMGLQYPSRELPSDGAVVLHFNSKARLEYFQLYPDGVKQASSVLSAQTVTAALLGWNAFNGNNANHFQLHCDLHHVARLCMKRRFSSSSWM